MTVTLLLDLDDTLLQNDFRQFMPAYLKLLSKHLSRYVSPEKTIRELLAATEVMMRNARPDRTLEETFDAIFYPALGLEKSSVRPVIEDFYANIFPTIKSVTAPRPDAARLIAYALQKGHHLAIATNPLFPRTAIVQRLAWAGFPPAEYPFLLVPSYDTFHFAKPNQAFFAELLGQIGWPNEPVVMVGNDPELDLKPAARIGLATFWVTREPASAHSDGFKPDRPGTLDDLVTWLELGSVSSNQNEADSQEALLATLRSTPAALLTLATSVTSDQISWRPAPDEWSFTEIACHLRDVDQEVNLPRMRKVLLEENAFLPGVVSDPWVEERAVYCPGLQSGFAGFCYRPNRASGPPG